MIDHKQYIKDATRTESVPEIIEVEGRLLMGALKLTLAASQILDVVKKKAFYRTNKNISKEDYDARHIKDKEILGAACELADDGIGNIEVWDFKDEHLDPDQFPSIDVRVFHGIVGLSTEAGELVEALLKNLMGEELDRTNLLEEIGDVNWFQAILVDALGGDLEKILANNIAKLETRYPEKFSDDLAANRNLAAEREVLEQVEAVKAEAAPITEVA